MQLAMNAVGCPTARTIAKPAVRAHSSGRAAVGLQQRVGGPKRLVDRCSAAGGNGQAGVLAAVAASAAAGSSTGDREYKVALITGANTGV